MDYFAIGIIVVYFCALVAMMFIGPKISGARLVVPRKKDEEK